MTPEDLSRALRERFPKQYVVPTMDAIAEAVLEIMKPDGPKLTAEQAEALLKKTEGPRIHPSVPGIVESEFERKKCQHCGGLHVRKCPAVKSIEYSPEGKVSRVVYFAEGDWSDTNVIWLEDVYEALEGGDDGDEG